MAYYEFIGEDKERKIERAEKYWEVSQVGKKVTIRFGKIGSDGQLIVKDFETKVTAKEIKAKRTPAIKKTEVKAEEVSTEVVAEKKAKPRRRRKPKAKPENGDQA